MFAPSPLRTYQWYLVEGRLRDGQELCIVNGVSESCQQTGNDIPSLKNYRWRTYWRYVGSDSEKELRPYLARYICDSWNRANSGGKELDELAIFKLQQPLRLDGSQEQPEKIQLWKDQCFAKDGTSGSKTE
jgi:hypothetical protein